MVYEVKHQKALQRDSVLFRAALRLVCVAFPLALAGCQSGAGLSDQIGAKPMPRPRADQPGLQRRPASADQAGSSIATPAQTARRHAVLASHFRKAAESDSRVSLESVNAVQNRRFPDAILHHGVGQSHGFFSETEHSWGLNPVATRQRAIHLPWMSIGKGRYLGSAIVCHYGSTEGHYRAITLWHVARPVIDPTLTVNQIYQGEVRQLTADIAIAGNCPSTWGEALTLVWGSDAWDRLRNSPQAKASLEDARKFERMNLEARRQWEERMAAGWAKLSEEERCLISNGVSDPESRHSQLGKFFANLCLLKNQLR